jgi:hypothetical protein
VAEESSFALWTPAAIGQREAALMKNVAPDHSSRETLADYGDHRFRLLYRDADGTPHAINQPLHGCIDNLIEPERLPLLGFRMIGRA